jgi:WD40 repeat protein
MMHLELPPEFVHVAFSDRVLGEDESQQKFGVMGEYGNNIVIYDSESFLIQHQIQVNNIVKSFKFANNNRDLLVITKDCKVRFYSLIKYEGIFMREVANCHRGSITGLDVSNNSGYMLTGGEDSMVKIWDYEAQKTVPYYFQSFIGHTYPLSSIIFNPRNNG